jgi:hypothetical protein
MTECIVIPQWVFAIVGTMMLAPSIISIRNEIVLIPQENEMKMLFSIVGVLVGVVILIYGIFPYLPCIMVLP